MEFRRLRWLFLPLRNQLVFCSKCKMLKNFMKEWLDLYIRTITPIILPCYSLSLRTLYANRLMNICIEIYKIKNGLNPKYMNDLITERPSQHQYRKPLDLLIPKSNQITFGYNYSFRTLAPTIWNKLTCWNTGPNQAWRF